MPTNNSWNSPNLTTNGQILIGSTGARPVAGNLTSTGKTLVITNGAGTVNADTQVVLQTDTGFGTWSAGGPYYNDTILGSFSVLVAGTGYINGVPVSWTAPQTISGLTSGNTYYIYIDTTGTIGATATRTATLFRNNICLYEMLYDETPGTKLQISVKENHPYNYPVNTSNYEHDNIGTLIENMQNGANITLKGTVQLTIAGADTLSDHGLYTTIADTGSTAVTWEIYYTLTTGKWARYAQTASFPAFYNNAGTPTALTGAQHVVYTLYASKDNITSSSPTYWAVMDTAHYASLSGANAAISNGTTAKISAELAMLEMTQLGYIVYANGSSSIVNVIISKATLRASFSTSGGNQASLISVDTSTFTNLLSASDSNVQAALNTIDALPIHFQSAVHGTALGTGALPTAINAGDGNTAVGNLSMAANTLGGDNTAEGYLSLSANTTGGDNTAIGNGALKLSVTDSFNTAVGSLCLNALNGSVGLNTAVGYGAGYTQTTGHDNTFLGALCGRNNLTGSFNNGIGSNCLYSLTTSLYNCALGHTALYSQTTGGAALGANVAIGYAALHNANVDLCVAIGYGAGQAATGGNYNTFVGGNTAANGIVTAGNNTLIGYAADYNLVGGASNVAVGDTALYSNTYGNYNTIVGAAALISTSSASYNTIIGYNAGSAYNGGESNNNLFGSSLTGVNGESNVTRITNISGKTVTGPLVNVSSTHQLGSVALTQFELLVGGASNAVSQIAAGTTGQVLYGNTGANPSWGTNTVTFISAVPLSSIGLVSFDLSTSGFTTYIVQFNNVVPNAGGFNLYGSFGDPSIIIGSYTGGYSELSYGGSAITDQGSTVAALLLTGAVSTNSTGINGNIWFYNMNTANIPVATADLMYVNNSAVYVGHSLSGGVNSTTGINYLFFQMSGGLFASGSIILYGVRTS